MLTSILDLIFVDRVDSQRVKGIALRFHAAQLPLPHLSARQVVRCVDVSCFPGAVDLLLVIVAPRLVVDLLHCPLCIVDHRPKKSAPLIDTFEKAGGIVLGKATMHELAEGFTTISTFFGPTLNPYRNDYHVGGKLLCAYLQP